MGRLMRTAFVSAVLLGGLGVLSFWFYHRPSQVERRVTAALGDWLAVSTQLDGCRSEPFGVGLRVASIRVPAAPPITERTLLDLEDVRLWAPGGVRGGLGLRRTPAVFEAGSVQWRVARARLVLEHRAADTGLDAWNFAGLLRVGRSPRELGKIRTQIAAEELELAYVRAEPGGAALRLAASLRAVRVRPDPDVGVEIEGDLEECGIWAGGRVRFTFGSDGTLSLGGRVDDLVLSSTLRLLLPPRWSRLVEELDPTGTVDLDVRSARSGGGNSTEVDILVHGHDTALRLSAGAARIDHLRGSVAIAADGLRFGRQGGTPPLQGELCGISVALDGIIAGGRGRVGVEIGWTALEEVALICRRDDEVSEPLGQLASLLAVAEPVGELKGRIEGELGDGDDDGVWVGDFEFRGLRLGRWPWLDGASGSLHVECGPTRRVGSLECRSLPIAGLGVLRGRMELAWDDVGVRLSATQLAIEAPAGERAGEVFGVLAWKWDGRLVEADLRGRGLRIETALFAAEAVEVRAGLVRERIEGRFDFGKTRIPSSWLVVDAEAAGDGESAGGRGGSEATPEKDQAAAGQATGPETESGGFGGEPGVEGDGELAGGPSSHVELERGGGSFAIADGVVMVSGLRIAGAAACVRAEGRIFRSAEFEFTAAYAPQADYRFRASALDAEGPGKWLRSAGAGGRLVRLSGSFDAPRARRLDTPAE